MRTTLTLVVIETKKLFRVQPYLFIIFFFRLINSEMRQETRTARAFEGIECATDVVQVDHNIWMYPILGQSNEQQ